MIIPIDRKVVYDSATMKVKRAGRTDFENDGSYDASTETIIDSRFVFDPPLLPPGEGEDFWPGAVPWYYVGGEEVFSTSAP